MKQPYLTHVLACLEASRAAVRAAVDGVPEGMRRTRPALDRWSVAEVLEHLALADRLFAARMTAAIDEALTAGSRSESNAHEPLPAGVARRMADRREARKAQEAATPAGTVDAAAAWAGLEVARAAVRDAAMRADGLALGSVRADHRLFGPLTIHQWAELTAAHEARHADQIREIGAALQGQPPPLGGSAPASA